MKTTVYLAGSDDVVSAGGKRYSSSNAMRLPLFLGARALLQQDLVLFTACIPLYDRVPRPGPDIPVYRREQE